MILLYSALIIVLGLAKFLIGRRVASLEKKYVRVAKEADALVKQSTFKDGNANRADPYVAAKRQYQIGLLAQKRDRVEAKYASWQKTDDRLGRCIAKLRSWKGKTLPYTFGAVDVVFVLGLIDYLGFGQYVSVRALVQLIKSRFMG
jgi:hypothetical protein